MLRQWNISKFVSYTKTAVTRCSSAVKNIAEKAFLSWQVFWEILGNILSNPFEKLEIFLSILRPLWENLTRVTWPPNSTPKWFPSFLLFTHLSYFLFIFYLPWCTLLDFPSVPRIPCNLYLVIEQQDTFIDCCNSQALTPA